MSREEWDGLGWDTQQAYLEGMEQDESVPLTINKEVPAEVIPGLRPGEPPAAAVIDITSMISGLEASRGRR